MNNVLTTLTLSQRNPIVYRLALLGWVVIALLCMGLFWVDLIADYFEIIVPCTEGLPGVFNDCNFAALTPAEVSVWTSWGLSLQTYGIIALSGVVFTSLVYTALSGLILWQQRQSWLGLMVSLALIIIPFTMNAASRNFGALHPTLGWLGNLAYLVGNGLMLMFLYLVPNGRFSPRWAYIPMLATFLLLFGPLDEPLVSTTTVLLVVFGGSLQLYRYLREANTVERQQTKWIIFGVVIFVTAIIAWVLVFGRALPIPDGQPRIIAMLISGIYGDFFALSFLPVAITIAILRYRLWDIDILIRRTLIYGLLSASLAILYFGMIILSQNAFRALTGQDSQLLIVLSTLVIAALFRPLRRGIQNLIDRRFYRQKYNAEKILAEFAEKARDEVELDALTKELTRVVKDTMQPAHLSLWLKEKKR